MHHIQVVIVLFTIISYSVEQFRPQGEILNVKREGHIPQANASDIRLINLAGSRSEKQEVKVSNNTKSNLVVTNTTSNRTENVSVPKVPKTINTSLDKAPEPESGMLKRAVLVFVGISFVFILYVGLQTYRRRKHDKTRTIIRKYGVRTNRADLEMEPLPLSDDEDDDTIFDLTASSSTNR